jgi:hypothetical protein
VTQTDNILIPAGGNKRVSQSVNVENPKFWSPDNPNLYFVKTEIIQNGGTVDTLETRFGIRYMDAYGSDGFHLNGQRIQFNGVCMHSDLGSLGMEVSQAAIDRQIRILKGMGVNAIRTAHNPVAPEYVEACDRMGMLLIEEIFDCWQQGKTWYGYQSYFDDNAERDTKAMVERDKNAPSIIMWSLGNEISESNKPVGLEILAMLRGYVEEIDTTRYITAGVPIWDNHNDWQFQYMQALDAAGLNYGEWLYPVARQKDPGMVIYGSETVSAFYSRGIYHIDTYGKEMAGYKAPDYQSSAYGNERSFNTAEKSMKSVRDNPFVAGEFIWTGFDYLGEPAPYPWPAKNSYFGAIDTAGFEKDVYYLYKSMWTDIPTVHILPQNWNYNYGDSIPVMIYTNAASVELFLNGESLGGKSFNKFTAETLHLEWFVSYVPGELKAVAKDAGGNITATDIVRTSGNARSVRLTPDRAFIKGDGKDMVFVEAAIVDGMGNIVPDAANRITFNIEGGVIAGVDNGNSIDHDSYKANNRKAFSGKALLIVKSTDGYEGDITITATAETQNDILPSNTLNIGSVSGYNANEKTIVEITKSEIVTERGIAPVMPETVGIVYGNGLIEGNISVVWGGISGIDLNTAGVYKIYGTVSGTALRAECDIHVKDVQSAEPAYITAFTGEAPVLPGFVNIIYQDGTTGAANVIWDSVSPDKYGAEGTFTVNGRLESMRETLAYVTVKSIISVEEITVDTTTGVIPIMPANIKVNLSDDTQEDVYIWWSVSQKDIKYAGINEVDGTIAGTGIRVKGYLNVLTERFLSDLQWKSAFQNGKPGLSIGINKSINGNKLTSRNVHGGPPFEHEKGLGTCADSEIVYDISGRGYERFRSYVSLSFDNGQECDGTVVFKVYLDDALAYQSPAMDYKETRQFIDLDITGADEIKLAVEHAGTGNKSYDLANWCGAEFLSGGITVNQVLHQTGLNIVDLGEIPVPVQVVTVKVDDGLTAGFKVDWSGLTPDMFGTPGVKEITGRVKGTTNGFVTAKIITDYDNAVKDSKLGDKLGNYYADDKFEFSDVAGKYPFTKDLVNSTLIYDWSNNMSAEILDHDNYGFMRAAYPQGPAQGYITYRGYNIKGFSLRGTASDAAYANQNFTILLSTDGISYVPFNGYTKTADPGKGWEHRIYSAEALPAGTNFIKIVFPAGTDWRFNLNRVTIYGGGQQAYPDVTGIKDNYSLHSIGIGGMPNLPETAVVEFASGLTAAKDVTWGNITSDMFMSPGIKTLYGEISGTNDEYLVAKVIVDYENAVNISGFTEKLGHYGVNYDFSYMNAPNNKSFLSGELLGSSLLYGWSNNMVLEDAGPQNQGTYGFRYAVYPNDNSGHGNIIYRAYGIKGFTLRGTAYTDAIAGQNFTISLSSDGINYTPYIGYTKTADPSAGWYHRIYTATGLPDNTNYIRIDFNTGESWKFNLNRVTVTGGIDTEPPDIIAAVINENKVNQVTFNVTDSENSILYLASYDENGRLLKVNGYIPEKAGKQSTAVNFDFENAFRVKAFLFDGQIKPLAGFKEIVK